MNAREQAALAPLGLIGMRISKLAAQNDAAGFETQQSSVDFGNRKGENAGQLIGRDGTAMRHPASDQRQEGVVTRKNRRAHLRRQNFEMCRWKNLRKPRNTFSVHPVRFVPQVCEACAALSDKLLEQWIPLGEGFF